MTTLATIVGLMPMALKLGEGTEASAPLARAAAGGLAVSTMLTLFLVPAIYEMFYRSQQVTEMMLADLSDGGFADRRRSRRDVRVA